MSSSDDNLQPLTLYDIAQAPPITTTACAPNPWKARLALNFKSLPFSTTWVPLPSVAATRRSLSVPAVRKFADGTDFYTLPVLHDPNTPQTPHIGDSFDIAVHLQQHYPTSGAGDLFPPNESLKEFQHDFAAVLVPLTDRRPSPYPEYAEFNVNVDAAFSLHTQLTCEGFPFDPATAEESKKAFAKRAGKEAWEELFLTKEARAAIKSSFKKTLGRLAALFKRDESGPFLLGAQPSYGDIIVGGWLWMFKVTLPKEEWEELRGWHDGVFGKLHDGLEVYADMK